MTVSSSHNKVNATGDGVQVAFTYDYLVLDEAHMVVFVNEVQQTSGYTVSGVGSPTGGTVTFDTAPPDQSIVTLLRSVPLTQLTDYIDYDKFPAETHETALDLLTMICQQLAEIDARAFTYGVSYDTSVIVQRIQPGNPGEVLTTADDGSLEFAESGALTQRGTVNSEGTNTLNVTLVGGEVVTVLKVEDLRGEIATRPGNVNPQVIWPSYTDRTEIWVNKIESGNELFGATHIEVAPPRFWVEP